MYENDDLNQPTIMSISMLESGVQITYVDHNDQSDYVELVKSIVVDEKVEGAAEDIADIIDAARSIIDAGHLELRNPPKKFTGRRRRREVVEEEDGE